MQFNSGENNVIEYASYSSDFINNDVDVAVIATITSANLDAENQIYDISVSNVEYLKGYASEEALNNVRIKGDINIGETYLMLFDKDEDDTLMMSSRQGSVIEANTEAAAQYESILVNN